MTARARVFIRSYRIAASSPFSFLRDSHLPSGSDLRRHILFSRCPVAGEGTIDFG